MKKTLLTGVVALFLATGTAHAYDAAKDGRSRHWIKSKNPAAPAVKREEEEDWENGGDRA
jgi:hypothetical protein